MLPLQIKNDPNDVIYNNGIYGIHISALDMSGYLICENSFSGLLN